MSDILGMIKKGMKVAPHANRIEENRKKVYNLSKQLPDEQGFELIQLFDNTIEEQKKIHKKLHEISITERD